MTQRNTDLTALRTLCNAQQGRIAELEAQVWNHQEWLKADSQYAENQRQKQRIAELEQQLAAVGEQLEYDRTAVAVCLTSANKAIDMRHWLTEGRGPYEWNDDNWHKEFTAAAIEIKDALTPLTEIAANWKDCPQTTEQVAQARIDLKAKVAELEAERDRLRDTIQSARILLDGVGHDSVREARLTEKIDKVLRGALAASELKEPE